PRGGGGGRGAPSPKPRRRAGSALFLLSLTIGEALARIRPSIRRAQQDELADVDLGRRDRHSVLLEAVVLHPTLDVDAIALPDVLLGDLCEAVPEGEPVPRRALFVAIVARHTSARGEGEVRDLGTVRGRGHVGVTPHVPHQDDLVDRAAHGSPPWRLRRARAAPPGTADAGGRVAWRC